jgi:coxsackievirus/adenovirus receptor
LPRCYCPDNCNEYVHRISSEGPICGTDNQTYETLCHLNKKACQTRQNITVAYIGQCGMLDLFSLKTKNKTHIDQIENCPYSNCSICNPHIQCLTDYHRICASNLQEYSNECEMNKYACQSNIRLTKLHDGSCDFHEQQQQLEGNRLLI